MTTTGRQSPAEPPFWTAFLTQSHNWEGRPTEAALAPLPNSPAVYLLVDEHERPVLLATTQQLRRLTLSRLTDPDRPKEGKTDLAEIVRGVRWRVVSAPFEARWWYYRLARELHPKNYRKLISFGPAWFLHVDWSRPIPEIRISERAWRDAGELAGPWSARAQCQDALNGLWDLFDLCRYPEQVRRAPQGQRCAYAEMGRCDAPCDGGAPLDAYVERNRAAWRFVNGGVAAWIEDAEQRMKAAATRLEFERAAVLKQQIDFARRWRSNWSPMVRSLEQFNYLLAIPVTRRKAWKLFLFRNGVMEEGPLLQDRKFAKGAAEWLKERLSPTGAESDSGDNVREAGLRDAGRYEQGGSQDADADEVAAAAVAAGDDKGASTAAEQDAPDGAKGGKRKAELQKAEPPLAPPFGVGDSTAQMEQTWLVAHLLFNRESDSAIITALRDLQPPTNLEQQLAETLAERRKRPEPEQSDEADVAAETATERNADAQTAGGEQ